MYFCGCAGSLLLCAGLSSSGGQGLLVVMHGLLLVASLIAETWSLGAWASNCKALGLSCLAVGIFLDQSSNLGPSQHSEIAKHKLYAAEGKDQNVLSFPEVLMNMENDKIPLHTHLHNY